MKAIKSVLANRKLFQGGGLVPPGNLNPANGILASSESLIDAVVRDAVGLQGAPTMSMTGGAMSMDQGGVARFQDGGLGTDLPSMAQPVSVQELPAISSTRQRVARYILEIQRAELAGDAEGAARLANQMAQELGPDAVAREFGDLRMPRDMKVVIEAAGTDVALADIGDLGIEKDLADLVTLKQDVGGFQEPPSVLNDPGGRRRSGPYAQALDEVLTKHGGWPAIRNRLAGTATASTDEALTSLPPQASEMLIAENVTTPPIETATAPAALTVEDVDKDDPYLRYLRAGRERAWTPTKYIGASLEDIVDQLGKGAVDRSAAAKMYGSDPAGEFAGSPYPAKVEDIKLFMDTAEDPAELASEKLIVDGEADSTLIGGEADATLIGGEDGISHEVAVSPRGEPKDRLDAIHDPSTLQAYLEGGGDPENAPSDATNRTVDSIIKDAISGIEDKPFDKEKFKQEIEALLPQVKDDPETKGWLIALIGASIMAGKDENAWVNIGAGLEKSLPALINFKGKQKEKQRDREMTVAKLTIESSLSREREDRAAIRGLETLGLTADIKDIQAAKELKLYRVQDNHLTPATLVGGQEGDADLYTPAGTMLNLDSAGLERATDAGLILLPWQKGSWKLSDFVKDDALTDLEQIRAGNATGTRELYPLFKGIVRNPVTINYITPSPGSLRVGGPSTNMIGINELQSVYSEYDRVRKPTLNLMTDIDDIINLVIENPGQFSGPGLVLSQLKDALKAVSGFPGAEQFAEFVEGVKGTQGENGFNYLSPAQQAQTRSLLIMAKIAPILLDESGKTISDTDRLIIARALGLKPIYNKESETWTIPMTMQVFGNPAALLLAMNQTQQALSRRLIDVDDQMRTALIKFGIPGVIDDLQRKQWLELEAKRAQLGTVEDPELYEQETFVLDPEKQLLYDWTTG